MLHLKTLTLFALPRHFIDRRSPLNINILILSVSPWPLITPSTEVDTQSCQSLWNCYIQAKGKNMLEMKTEMTALKYKYSRPIYFNHIEINVMFNQFSSILLIVGYCLSFLPQMCAMMFQIFDLEHSQSIRISRLSIFSHRWSFLSRSWSVISI